LKGEYEALRSISVQKKCANVSKSPEELIKEKEEKRKEREGAEPKPDIPKES
jgi:hypothetical protein